MKCYQRLGYFPKLADVPAVVVDHVREKLGLAEDVAAEADAVRTGKRHRQFVRDRLDVKYEAARVREVAEAAIRKAVQSKDNPADLINVALDELVRQRCELPGYTTLDSMATSIRTEVNSGMFRAVATRPSRAERARLERLLLVDPATRRSEFDRLKAPAQAATIGNLKNAWRTWRRWMRWGRPRRGWRGCRRARSRTSLARRGRPTRRTCARSSTTTSG